MKHLLIGCVLMVNLCFCAWSWSATPTRVALLDFENQATPSTEATVGGIAPQVLAEKGIWSLGQLLVSDPAYTLIDRRDFINQINALQLTDNDKKTTVKPSFLRAAQAVNAEVVLRGILLSYSPGKEIINQGGHKTEFQTFALRVMLQALDTRDGSVIAMAEGAGKKSFRITDAHQTVVGEDELLQILRSALAQATPDISTALAKRRELLAQRPTVKLTVKASGADPALVEIDGALIGSTPLVDFEIYAGDHVITLGKAGYQDVSKHVILKTDTVIDAPLFRTRLSADEMKAVLDKARVNIMAGSGGVEPIWIIHSQDAP